MTDAGFAQPARAPVDPVLASRSGAAPASFDTVQQGGGLYQLVAIRQETQDHSFVSKPVAIVEEFARLCNAVATSSFDKNTRAVDFGRLDDTKLKATAFFGYNDDVWRALLNAGLKPGAVAREALQEGLLVFCPWLAEDAQSDADAASTDSWELGGMDTLDAGSGALSEDCQRVYLAAWAGDAARTPTIYPPFNLTLRLLVALCQDIIIPVSLEAAEAFDESQKPFESGEGITEDYSVQQHTSANTALQIQKCKKLVVNVDPRLWQRGAPRDAIFDIIPAQIGMHWHSASKGAALVSTYHATLRAMRTEMCVVPGTNALDLKKHKICLDERLLGRLHQQMGELRRRLHSCMPPPGMSAPDRGRAEVVAFFSAVLRTPAVLLLQHWQPEVFSTHRQELAALQQDVTKIVSELQQRGHQSKRPSAESEQLLQEYITEATKGMMQRWFPSNSMQPDTGNPVAAESSRDSHISQTARDAPMFDYRAAVKGGESAVPNASVMRPSLQEQMGAASISDALPKMHVLEAKERQMQSELGGLLDRRFIMQQLAHPFAWEALVRGALPPRTQVSQTGLQEELVRIVCNGIQKYMRNRKLSSQLAQLGISRPMRLYITSEEVVDETRKNLVSEDGKPTKAMKVLLRKHPHTFEIISLVAAKCLTPVLRDRRDAGSGRVTSLLNLAVEGIAAWVELDMVTSVEDEMIMFCKGSVSALSLFIPDAQHCVGTRTGTEATTVQREAMRAGFSRDKILQETLVAAVVPQHVPPPYSDFFDPEDMLLHGVQHALKRAQEKYTTHNSEAVNSRRGFLSWIPNLRRSEGDMAAPLDAAGVLARSQEHARMLLRCQVDTVERMLGLPLLQQIIHVSFTRLLAALIAAPPKAFSGTRAELDAQRALELRRDLLGRFTQSECDLDSWLQGTTEALRRAAQASTAAYGGTYTIKDIQPVASYAGLSKLQLEFEHECTSSAFGSWTANVLSKSAQGEDADVALDCQVVDHQENVSFVEMLGVAAGPASSFIISVRLKPGTAYNTTQVFVHPRSSKPSFQHSKLQERRPVLAARYEPTSRILALLLPAAQTTGEHKHVIAFCAFTPDYKNLQTTRELPVSLPGQCSSGPEGVPVYTGELPFVLLPAVADSEGGGTADKMALILEEERVALYNILSKSWEPESLAVATAGKQWLCTPCRTALLAVRHDDTLGRWLLDAYSLEDGGTAQPLFWQILKDADLPPEVASLPCSGPRFTAAAVEGGTYLLAANGHELFATSLKLQSIHVENALAEHGAAADTSAATSDTNRLLNYIHSCCLRFPLDDCIGLAEATQHAQKGGITACRTVRLYMATADEGAGQRMVEYAEDLIHHALHIASQKPAGRLLALQPCVAPSVADALEGSAASGEDFGKWILTAMCLLPLQLSRCMGNTLEPMHDGEPRRGVDTGADGDIDGMARALRLGLYESVLASHTGPVKFVCALGQQSTGKSYQLNHLGGTLFNVAGGRCTDGVWMSVRFMRDSGGAETAVVFLDCEGIGSPQRHEVEDMLHCLLVGAVSSLTMFKTHFAFTTELKETLKRINKGAERVADICGSSRNTTAPNASGTASSSAPVMPPEKRRVFRGSIMFCLKDVPPDSMRSIIRDFKLPLDSMVRSVDNFVSAIYNNSLAVSAFPSLSRSFYSSLQRDCVGRLQREGCPSYANGPDAGYTLKMMMMKVAHKDWTAIDRQLIVSKAKAVRAVMLGVVHHGCEAALKPDGSPLGSLRLQFSDANEQRPSKSELQQVTFTVSLPAYVFTSDVVQDILQHAQSNADSKLDIKPSDAKDNGALPTGTLFGGDRGDALSLDPWPGAVRLGRSAGTSQASSPLANTAHGTSRPVSYAGAARAFRGPQVAGPVAEAATDDDDDDASSMGASGFGDNATRASALHAAPFMGAGIAVEAAAEPTRAPIRTCEAVGVNRFALLDAQESDVDMMDVDNTAADEGADGEDASMASRGVSRKGSGGVDSSSDDDWAINMRQSLLGLGGTGTAEADGDPDLAARMAGIPFGGSQGLTPTAADGGKVKGGEQAVVQMQWTLPLPDHELRLGSVVQEAGAAEGVLGVPEALLQQDLRALRVQLMDALGLQRPDKDANEFRLLQAALQGLLQGLLRRRRAVATAWLAQATAAIADTPEASELQSALADHLRRLDAAWQVCGATCADCLLPCCELGSHAQHSCSTDHRCKADCAFCEQEMRLPGGGIVHSCSGKAGHHGRHMCKDKPHACGRPCALKGRAENCNGVCAREPQHEGECDCECGNHLCGAACSLPGCSHTCKEPWGAPHDRHSCGATACPMKCPLCGGGCPGGHFHALEEPDAHHLCGAEHRCMQPGTLQQSLCSHTGGCSIEGQIEKVPRRFKGKRGEFEYDAVTRQNMQRKVCTVMVPPGELRHDGPCSCGRAAEEHYCGAPCPQCLYRCTKAAGHEGRHRAPHGNLENSHFLSSAAEFDLKDRKYAVGDSAIAETCDSFCTNCGRGHLHFVKCDKTICGSALHDCARHSSRDFAAPDSAGGPGKALKMDEYTHDFHWEKMGFEDPVKTADDLRTFRMCGNFCTCEEHLQADGSMDKKYCLLPLWHAPLDPRSDPNQARPADCTVADVFISEDGCLLPCKHVTVSDVHTFFVIDRSGSMGSPTICPDSRDIREHARFLPNGDLDNVLGVVYEAANKYILERIARAPRDVATFIPFNDHAKVDFAGWPVQDGARLLDRMMQTEPMRGTKFDQALLVMQGAVARWRAGGTDNLKPVVILLTDSEDWVKASSVDVLQHIMEGEKQLPEAERLTVHVIGFGPGVDESFIQQLATIGCGSHFTCQAARDMDRTNLVKAFSRIAARPGDQVALVPN